MNEEEQRGPTGRTGATGRAGAEGARGAEGAVGARGERGERAYLTWPLIIWGYTIPMVVFVTALTAGWVRLGNQHDDLCRIAVTNSSVNLAQNKRLEALLDSALATRKARGDVNGFALAVATAKADIEKENVELTAQIDCAVEE